MPHYRVPRRRWLTYLSARLFAPSLRQMRRLCSGYSGLSCRCFRPHGHRPRPVPILTLWMLDFGLSRLPAVPSTGIVTFSRFAPNLAATIPVGSIVKTSDGSLSFSVTEDDASSIWQPASSGYIIPSGVPSADLPVMCITYGSIGNVLSGTINVISASLPGVDQVNNANPLSNGVDAETDQAFRSRFQGYLASRSRATLGAVQNAIANVRQGLDVAIEQNTGPGGGPLSRGASGDCR